MSGTERTHFIESRDGTRLHVREIGSEGASKTLVVAHGYGEHGGRYLGSLTPFADAGYRVVIPDLRGHGKSGGARGHVMSWSEYLDDLDAALRLVSTPASATALFGHSNGGLVVAAALLQRTPAIAAAALTSPLFAVRVKAPRWKTAAARLLSRIAPRVSLPTEVDPAMLSHDPAVVKGYSADPLNHFVANARWYTEMLTVAEKCMQDAVRLAVPTLVVAAGADGLVDADAAERWARACPPNQIRFERVDGGFHELLNEPDGERHARRLLKWFDEHLSGAAGT